MGHDRDYRDEAKSDAAPSKYVRVKNEIEGGTLLNMSKSIKLDDGKTAYSLLPVLFLEKLADLLQKGAIKYARDNWRVTGFRYSRAEDALWRHLQAWRNGEDLDAETGCHHMAAIAFYCMCIIEYHFSNLSETQNLDDRYKKTREAKND